MQDVYFIEHMLPEERDRMPYLSTFPEWIDFIADTYDDQSALGTAAGLWVTYRQLRENIAKRRGSLRGHGLRKGDIIGLLDGNTVECVEWFLAAASAGLCCVMLPAQLRAEGMPGMAGHYELKAIVAGARFAETARAAGIPVILTEEKAEESAPAALVSSADLAAIFFTGGTTGTPKGVMLSHGALLRGSLNGTYRDGTVFGQTFVSVLPLTHVFGMLFSLLSGLYTGSAVAMCPEMREMFHVMAAVRPTTMIAVPGLADLMLGMARLRGPEILGGRLKLIICGAAPVPPRLREDFRPYGIDVLAGYGLTETANLVSGNLEMDLAPESVGHQYPCQERKIVDGELWVRGDMLFSGYWKNPEATAAVMEDGWLKTGDLARVDEEGFLYIVGRAKNLIILSNGENVSPEEVEAVFYRSHFVKDCLVYEDEILGRPAIFLEVQGKEGVADEELLRDCKRLSETMPSMMRPSRMLVRHKDFRKSPSMKIIRDQEHETKEETHV